MTENLPEQPEGRSCDCEPSRPSRRNFLRTIVISAAALVVLPATLASADNVPVTWVDLGQQPEPTTTWTKIVLPDAFSDEIIFIRKVVPQAGSVNMTPIYQAVSARCSHRHCVVAYQPDSITFLCPCHGGTFDSNAYPIAGPPKNALPPLLCQFTPSSNDPTKGHLLVEAPNAISITPPQ
jgi:Rieske Fe-S protein